MKYRRLKIELRNYPKRLNRVLLIREDLNMIEVGVIISNSLKCWMEHMFLFRKGKHAYLSEVMYEDCESEEMHKMSDYILKNFGDQFYYGYDPGENWDFKCTVLDIVEKEGLQLAYMEDAEGLGIWENNYTAFEAYIEGKIKPNSSKENLSKGYFLPENLMISTYGEYDDFDYLSLKNEFEESVEYDVYDYVMAAHQNGYEMDVVERRPAFENDHDDVDDMFEGFEQLSKEYASMHIESIPRIKRVYEFIKNDAGEEVAFELIQGTLLKNLLRLTGGMDENYLYELEQLIDFDDVDGEVFKDDDRRRFN